MRRAMPSIAAKPFAHTFSRPARIASAAGVARRWWPSRCSGPGCGGRRRRAGTTGCAASLCQPVLRGRDRDTLFARADALAAGLRVGTVGPADPIGASFGYPVVVELALRHPDLIHPSSSCTGLPCRTAI